MYKFGKSRDPGVRELLELLEDLEAKGADEATKAKLKLGLDLIEVSVAYVATTLADFLFSHVFFFLEFLTYDVIIDHLLLFSVYIT